MTRIERLCAFAQEIRFENLPPVVVDTAKRSILDALACAFAAVGCPPETIAEKAYGTSFGGSGTGTVIGRSRGYSTEASALLNGILVRYLDWMDTYGTFSRDFVTPAENVATALACCEEASTSGKTLIEALVVGYEAQTRFADAYSFT